ncbi:MAG: antibiotic biosynthesis monooxygenase [Bacilli bacterium]|jgi:heme-degrading monooxygenase HmoA|uniref:Antibiotic biosynthesis monooxygenase family protein n=1 Tax=Ureibacillus suwonensis TaxID=313007 RepID=A0ABW0RD99_9BACL|nr:antibiotic biosynthesis monooxygenase [Bacilli bacterium]
MNFYMTTGTPTFMEKLHKKYEHEKMLILYGANQTLLLHETAGKTVFQTPRKYEVVDGMNELQQAGYFTFYHIPVSDEGRPVFEKNIVQRLKGMKDQTGLTAMRLLRPKKSETYIILLQWKDKRSYDIWKKYDPIAQELENFSVGVKKDNIFNAATYISTYSGAKQKEGEENES